jgi:hypothetical protein
VKFATSVGHLEDVGQQANDYLRLRDSDIPWPLDELWVGSDLLDGRTELETTPLILSLDAPPDDLTWLALHPAGDWICEQLHLTKRPISWRYRPSVYPAWNCRDRRVVRFWSAKVGYESDVIEALRGQRFDQLHVVTPSEAEFAGQLKIELEMYRRHLSNALDQYWEPNWRHDHKGYGLYPEDHLWRAAAAVREIETRLAALPSTNL